MTPMNIMIFGHLALDDKQMNNEQFFHALLQGTKLGTNPLNYLYFLKSRNLFNLILIVNK